MQPNYLARLDFPKFDPSQGGNEISSLILGFFAFIFAMALVGMVLYLYVAGALHTFALRPFRVAVYIAVLFLAMTAWIGFIQNSSKGCETADNLEGSLELPQVTLAAQC
ncbi:MAG: hypothetical protein ABI988_20245 [Nitrospirota bacterium]